MGQACLSLMIVDDEKLTRESLQKYVPWTALDIQTVRVARNGHEALELARERAPEVLLTDVRMPKMDGLELAARIRTLNPGCQVVFLSGYADKEYLKKAIRLHAVSYVEKPVDLSEVQEAVRLAVDAWLRESGQRMEAQRLRESVRETREMVRDEIARALVRGDTALRTLAAATDDGVAALGADTPLTAAALRFQGLSRHRAEVLAACGALAPFNLRTSFAGFTDDNTLALVVARPVLPTRGSRSYQDLLLRIQDKTQSAAVIGIGTCVRGPSAIPRSFDTALQALRLGFYRGGADRGGADRGGADRGGADRGGVYFPSPPAVDRFEPDPRNRARLRECLAGGDRAGAIQAIRDIAGQATREEPADVESVRDVFARILAGIADDGSLGADPPQDVWREVRRCATVAALTGLAIATISTHTDEGRPDDARLPRKLREARRYLRTHCTDPDLTLGSIAQHVGLSRTYLSALYKAGTGRNVAEELTELRIGRAMELLRDPRAKTRVVAARVGYRDPSYFSALFRKRVGKSPTEYRDGL